MELKDKIEELNNHNNNFDPYIIKDLFIDLFDDGLVEDIEIIDAITASRLKASGAIVTSDEVLNTGVQSSDTTNTLIVGGDN